MYDIDSTDTHVSDTAGDDTTEVHGQSPTAAACEQAALYGATPERGEFDSREIWDRDEALDALSEAIRILVAGVTVDGTQLADEREPLLRGFANMLHAQTQRLDRAVDRIAPEMKDLARAQDGTEIKARELELLTDRARNLGDRCDAFETMRDLAADAYSAETGETWRPCHGSHASLTGKLTSAAIDARDFLRARKDREIGAYLPEGTLVAVAGGKHVADPAVVVARLDKAMETPAGIGPPGPCFAHGPGRVRRLYRPPRRRKMPRNDQKDREASNESSDDPDTARRPHSIRFSDSEWSMVEWAAARHGLSAGELVRSGALAGAEDRLGESLPATLSPGHIALIEATYRAVYMLATQLLDAGAKRRSTTSSRRRTTPWPRP